MGLGFRVKRDLQWGLVGRGLPDSEGRTRFGVRESVVLCPDCVPLISWTQTKLSDETVIDRPTVRGKTPESKEKTFYPRYY